MTKIIKNVLLFSFIITIVTILVSFFVYSPITDGKKLEYVNGELKMITMPVVFSIADTTHLTDTLITNSESFARGCCHGTISVITGIISLINGENIAYENNRNNYWYLIGFIIGLLSIVHIVYFFCTLDSSGSSNDDYDDNSRDDWNTNLLNPVNPIGLLNPASPLNLFK